MCSMITLHKDQKQFILASIQTSKYFFSNGENLFVKAVTRGDCLVLWFQSRYNDDGIVQQNICDENTCFSPLSEVSGSCGLPVGAVGLGMEAEGIWSRFLLLQALGRLNSKLLQGKYWIAGICENLFHPCCLERLLCDDCIVQLITCDDHSHCLLPLSDAASCSLGYFKHIMGEAEGITLTFCSMNIF